MLLTLSRRNNSSIVAATLSPVAGNQRGTREKKTGSNGWSMAMVVLSSLVLGVVYYWFIRPPGSADFLKAFPASPFSPEIGVWFSRLCWVPSFLHVFAFSILTWLVLGRRGLLFACLFWSGVNILFELGQSLPAEQVALFPDVLNLHSYFSTGVFDPLDLAACIAGALTAFYLEGFIRKKFSISGYDTSGSQKTTVCQIIS